METKYYGYELYLKTTERRLPPTHINVHISPHKDLIWVVLRIK